MKLIGKELFLDCGEILYQSKSFTAQDLMQDFVVYGGEWTVDDGWLVGKNPLNAPGMLVLKQDCFGDVLLDFHAATIPPCTHDIDFMWNGSWDEHTNERATAYVGGLCGWWNKKTGFEKSPEYKLNATTTLFSLTPGQTYHVQAGSAQGHLFLIVDGQLIVEATDSNPIDTNLFGKIGFEAYCSQIKITDLVVEKFLFRGDRESVRNQTIEMALKLVLDNNM